MAISPTMRRDSVRVMTDSKPVPRSLWHPLTKILSGEFPGLLGPTSAIPGELFGPNHGGYLGAVIVGVASVR